MTGSKSIPPAQNITILAADLLATRAGQLLDALAHAHWEPADKLRDALATYSEVRLGIAVRDESDPQCCQLNDPAPITERSVHHG